GASDYAVTQNGGDYTVHVLVGIDPQGRMYLLDLWRGLTTPDVWVDKLLDLADRWKPVTWAEEGGQIKASIGPFLERRMLERKVYFGREQFPTRHDKGVRAQAIRGHMARNGLYVPTKAPWVPSSQPDLLSFPAGKNDDMVDALGLIGQLLDQVSIGLRLKFAVPAFPPTGYSDRYGRSDSILTL